MVSTRTGDEEVAGSCMYKTENSSPCLLFNTRRAPSDMEFLRVDLETLPLSADTGNIKRSVDTVDLFAEHFDRLLLLVWTVS
ncbi:hypothetical protein J6590_009109 [Homalodisca vitripennis]|nr:hypothetical protein J6590_009109 [Homalodisca vitripennis]